MKSQNIQKFDLANKSVIQSAADSYDAVIDNLGTPVDYYSYHAQSKTFLDPIHIKCYLETAPKNEEGSVEANGSKLATFSAPSLFNSTVKDFTISYVVNSETGKKSPVKNELETLFIRKPNTSDKVVLGNEEYFVREVFFYDINTEVTNTIENAIAIAVLLVKGRGFSRLQMNNLE